MPKVSVMVPAYNHERYVAEALESVLNQTMQDFEIVVSDDHSLDKTVEVLQKYKDPRISLHVFPENVGATINHEYCWKHCTAPYIALLNSDDVWYPKHLEKAVSYLDKHPSCGAVFSWCSYIDEESQVTDPCSVVFKQPNRSRAEWLKHFFTSGNCICHPSMVIRKEAYDQIGFYSHSLRQLPDFFEWVKLVKKYDIHIIPEVLVKHRRCDATQGNTSTPVLTNSLRDVAESKYILSHFFDDVDDVLFQEAFSSLFRNPKAKTHEELLCERFFLMADCHWYLGALSLYAAFDYFQEIYQQSEIRRIFSEKYGYTISQFYALGSELDYLGLKKTPMIAPIQQVVMEGNPNSAKNRVKALAWAIFGKDTGAYHFLKQICKKASGGLHL